MCQCGCSEFYRRFKLPGPNGVFWVFEISHGCVDCQTPAGVIVSRLGSERRDELETILNLDFPVPEKFTRSERAFVVADPERLHQVALSAVLDSHSATSVDALPDDSPFDEDELRLDIYHCLAETRRT